ncbi:hypothetical protein C1H46_002813, partial [Malus baccata]
KKIEHICQEVDQRDDKSIVDLQQLTNKHTFKVSTLWEDHKRLLEEEFDVKFLTGYAQ